MKKEIQWHWINRHIKRLKNFIKKEEKPIGNDLNVRKTDIFLTSYPRSGNTWIRFVLGEIYANQRIDFANMEDVIPDIYRSSQKKLNKINNPRILKSHEQYDKRYKKTIYIIRDPRDVCLSYYRWLLKFRNLTLNLDEFIDEFINPELYIKYGRWDEHVCGWTKANEKNKTDIFICTYENLVQNPLKIFNDMVDFISFIDTTHEQVEEAVINNSKQNMRKKEKEGTISSSLLKNSRLDISFIGENNAQKENDLSPTQRIRIEDSFSKMMAYWGYI